MKRAAALLVAALATACGALIGTRDLTYDEHAGDGGASSSSGSTSSGGSSSSSGGSSSSSSSSGGDGGCVADLKTDKKNCGRCGHDCLGGDCNDGQCTAVTLTSADEPLGVTTVGDTVYFTEYFLGQVWKVKKTGGVATAMTDPTSDAGAPPVEEAWGITNDGANLYVASRGSTNGGVYKCPLDDCKGAALKKLAPDAAFDVATKNGAVYFTGYYTQDVFKVNVDGTGKQSLVSASTPFHLSADDTHVYFTNNTNNLLRVVVGGGTAEGVGPSNGDFAGSVFVDANRVYWTDNFASKAAAVRGKSKSAGTTVDYKNTGFGSVAIAADAKYVYWGTRGTDPGTSSDASVYAEPVDGGAILELAKNYINITAITLDADAVYFVDTNSSSAKGGVYKVAKP